MPLRQTRRSITNYIKIQINFKLIKPLNLEFKPIFLFSPLLHLKYDQSKIRIILKRQPDQNLKYTIGVNSGILFFSLKFYLRVQVLSSCIKGAHPHWIRAYCAFSNLKYQSIFEKFEYTIKIQNKDVLEISCQNFKTAIYQHEY